MKKILLSWSSGKDSAWALNLMQREADLEIAGLLTTFNSHANRVAMHGVRRALVEAQAERVGIPLWPVELPWPCSNASYEENMAAAFARAVEEGITGIAFGDLFLEDIRLYRVQHLRSWALEPIFPVWHIPTHTLALQMIKAGQRAKITCVDLAKLDASFAGRDYDEAFLTSLPPGIDPCGENGEFHTFVYDCPKFAGAIPVRTGEIITADGFAYADICPDL